MFITVRGERTKGHVTRKMFSIDDVIMWRMELVGKQRFIQFGTHKTDIRSYHLEKVETTYMEYDSTSAAITNSSSLYPTYKPTVIKT